MIERERERFLARLEPAKLEKFYAAYIEYVFGMDYLMRGNYERDLLFHAFSRFPCLQGIRCSYPEQRLNQRIHKLSFKQLSPIAQELLKEPDDVSIPVERTQSF